MRFAAPLAALALAVSPAAQALTMTFNNLPAGVSTMPTYTEAGITATGPGDFWNLPNGSLHLDACCVPENNDSYVFTVFSGPFDLISFDVTSLAGTAVVQGRNALSQLIYSTTLPITSLGTISFTGWTGMHSLSITAIGAPDPDDPHFSIDNLVLGVVPEPASWALLIAGFGLVGGAMRRRAALA